ncbi:MAG: transcriptional regulator [Armatimonadetes bacterium]|nr:transcriptional regulator [Armatimonadota bacterium]MDE2206997.1 transcriptional regulator [Armatimonadota bacterium]
MNIRPIRSEDDYHAALAQMESLMDAVTGSTDEDTLDVLATLIEAHEKRFCPIAPPDPIDALRYYIESRGITPRQLQTCIGSRARVNEVLNRRRALTITMIRKLSGTLGIASDILIRAYPLSAATPRRPGTRLGKVDTRA